MLHFHSGIALISLATFVRFCHMLGIRTSLIFGVLVCLHAASKFDYVRIFNRKSYSRTYSMFSNIRPCFLYLNKHFPGPKTVKLYTNREHMGFRYSLSMITSMEWWFNLANSNFYLHIFDLLIVMTCIFSNVNDFPPSDTAVLTADNNKVEFQFFRNCFTTIALC